MNPWNRRRSATLLAGLVLGLTLTSTAQAQSDWPNRPIKIIVPTPAGGAYETGPLLWRRVAAL